MDNRDGKAVDLMDTDISKGPLVKQHNELTMAAYTLTPTAKRCLWMALHGFQQQFGSAAPPDRDHWVEISAEEFANLFLQGDTRHAYRHIRQGTEELLRTLVRVNRPTSKDPNAFSEWQIGSVAEHTPGSGVAMFRFHERALPYISRLPPGFTKIYLHGPARLRGEYAQRLYEMMVQFRPKNGDEGWLEITIEELRRRFQLGNRYAVFGDLNKRVIQQAVKEIEAKSNLTVDVTKIKKGKKVVALRFSFMEEKQMDIFKN